MIFKIQLVFGICIMISPWVFGYYEVTSARWINVVFGFAVVFAALFGILGRESTPPGNPKEGKV